MYFCDYDYIQNIHIFIFHFFVSYIKVYNLDSKFFNMKIIVYETKECPQLLKINMI